MKHFEWMQTEDLDRWVLSRSNEQFMKAARVIGHSLVDMDFSVGDGYLNWRLKELV